MQDRFKLILAFTGFSMYNWVYSLLLYKEVHYMPIESNKKHLDFAEKRIEYFKKERKGFSNFFNGYRAYCNLQIIYWKEFIEYCKEVAYK